MKKILLTLLTCTGIAASTFAQTPVADFSGNPTTICAGKSVTWSNLSTGAFTYTWSFPGATGSGGGTPTSSNSTNPGPRTYANPGVYDVSLVAYDGVNTDTQVKTGYITVIASPTISVSPSPGYVGCSITSATLTASGANSYVWSPAATLNTSTGAVVVASPTITTMYTVIGTNSNGCTSQHTTNVSVSNSPPAAPTGLTGATTVCSGQSGVVYYVAGVGGTPPYRNWTVPAGATITSGQGTRSVTVTFGSTSGDVCCSTVNACGTSSVTCIAVTVNQTPSVGVTGTIVGPTSVCDNQTGVIYTLPPVANASSYTWTENSNATITSGQNTNTITVTFATSNNTNICVTPSNSCGTGTQSCLNVTSSPSAPAIPGTISGPTTVCSGSSSVGYSVASVTDATVYTWTVPTGATISAGQGTNSVSITYGSASGSVCVTAGNGCGTSGSNCIDIYVDPNPAVGTIGTITGSTSACANQSGVVYTVPSVTNATSYNWTVPSGANITAGTGTNSITVTFGSVSGNICVTADNNCSSSSQSCYAVTVSPNAPAIPGSITGPTTVCSGQTGVSYSIASVANATVYTWTVPAGATITAGQGTNSINVTLGNTTGTVAVTAGNACGTSIASSAVVTVDPNPAVGTIGAISGPTAVCANQSGISFSIPAVTGASTYTWSVPTGASITAGQGTNSITITYGTTDGSVCVYAGNSCSTSPQKCLSVVADQVAPTIPTSITGPTTVCSGQANEVYTTPTIAVANVYTWTVPAGATIVSGQGTNTISVTFGSNTGTVSVTAGNACGTSLPNFIVVNVDPNPVVGAIGAITGPVSACANQSNVVFSTPAVSGATTYNWTVPSGASITGGQGTATITVSFGSTGGNVCVEASNSCSTSGQSCMAVAVSSTAPAIPGGITGITTVCSGQAGEAYSIAPVANASVYTWTVPAGASIVAGQGTTSISVTFGSTTGNISVTAGNACGTSIATTLMVNVDPNPAVGAITAINGPAAACANQSNVIYIIPAVANATNYTWTIPTAATISAGQGTNTITVSFGNVSGNICVSAANTCGVSPQSCEPVTVSPSAPGIPTGLTGATMVCSGQVSAYSITPVINAISYAWTVNGGATVSAGQGTANATIAFGSASSTVCVTAGNGCGTSLPTCQTISVSATALTVSTTVTNTSNSSVCDGSATAIPGGGTGPFTYAWTPSGDITATASGLCFGSHTVCVTDAAGCVTCSTVNVSSPTGVTTLTDYGTIRVFPNPANEFIFIEGTISNAATLHINVVNMFGQQMINESVHADGTFSQKVNIESIPSGVYFIQISSGEMVRNSRIIKIK